MSKQRITILGVPVDIVQPEAGNKADNFSFYLGFAQSTPQGRFQKLR